MSAFDGRDVKSKFIEWVSVGHCETEVVVGREFHHVSARPWEVEIGADIQGVVVVIDAAGVLMAKPSARPASGAQWIIIFPFTRTGAACSGSVIVEFDHALVGAAVELHRT